MKITEAREGIKVEDQEETYKELYPKRDIDLGKEVKLFCHYTSYTLHALCCIFVVHGLTLFLFASLLVKRHLCYVHPTYNSFHALKQSLVKCGSVTWVVIFFAKVFCIS